MDEDKKWVGRLFTHLPKYVALSTKFSWIVFLPDYKVIREFFGTRRA